MSAPTILIVGTLDTKCDELLFLRSQILSVSNRSCATKVLDTSRAPQVASALSVPELEIIPGGPRSDELDSLSRGEYVTETIHRCIPIVQRLIVASSIHGIISAGGSSGTSLATALMREACPVGFPKVMVSTMASGDVKHLVGETDITMMYSVVDIAGINSILRRILANAAGAIVGMANAYVKPGDATSQEERRGKRIAITMFGVTTPCVDAIRRMLESPPHDKESFEVYVFHATGRGGSAMERLIREGQIDAVIDLTTSEIPDELFGGVLTAGPNRLEAGALAGIPMVVSVGACDMVNFGPKDTVPEKRRARNLYEHNPAVTLMRTTKEENIEIGRYIAEKLSTHAQKPKAIKVLLPLSGVSMIDQEGQSFHDPEADEALFSALKEGLKESDIQVTSHDKSINDEVFARAVVQSIIELMQDSKSE